MHVEVVTPLQESKRGIAKDDAEAENDLQDIYQNIVDHERRPLLNKRLRLTAEPRKRIESMWRDSPAAETSVKNQADNASHGPYGLLKQRRSLHYNVYQDRKYK